MTTLAAIEKNGTLVVDSRLIAKELGIEHESFFKTINKYRTEAEESFGHLRFEIGTVQNSVGAVNNVNFAFLSEEQSSFYMTLSRNTPKVIRCKAKLVKAFDSAKKAIASQSSRIKELEMQLELSRTQERLSENQLKLLATVQLLETVSPGLAPLALGRQDAVVERIEYIERTITPDATYEGVGIGYIRKRFGFKTDKLAWAWLESIGYGRDSGKWDLQLAAVEHRKLPPELLYEVVKKFARHEGDRQLFIGE